METSRSGKEKGEGRRKGGKQTLMLFLEEVVSKMQTQSLEPPGGHGEQIPMLRSVQVTQGLSLQGRGDSHQVFWTSQFNSLLAQQLEQKVAAENQALWAEWPFWVMHQVPTTRQPNSESTFNRTGRESCRRPSELWIKALAVLLRQIPNTQNSVKTVYLLPKNILQPEFNPKNDFCLKQGCWSKLMGKHQLTDWPGVGCASFCVSRNLGLMHFFLYPF